MFSRLNGGVGREPAGMAIWGVLSWSYKRRHKERNPTPQFGPKSWPWASCMAPSPVANKSQAWAPGGTCSCSGFYVPSGSGDSQEDILWHTMRSFLMVLEGPSQPWFSNWLAQVTQDLMGKAIFSSCSLTSQPGLLSKMVTTIPTSWACWDGKGLCRLRSAVLVPCSLGMGSHPSAPGVSCP